MVVRLNTSPFVYLHRPIRVLHFVGLVPCPGVKWVDVIHLPPVVSPSWPMTHLSGLFPNGRSLSLHGIQYTKKTSWGLWIPFLVLIVFILMKSQRIPSLRLRPRLLSSLTLYGHLSPHVRTFRLFHSPPRTTFSSLTGFRS